LRWTTVGAALAGLVGGVAGLVIGLLVYPPTAWFAVFELGIPASIVGGLVGLVRGAIATAIGRSHRLGQAPPNPG
jgi:hypothetical protein